VLDSFVDDLQQRSLEILHDVWQHRLAEANGGSEEAETIEIDLTKSWRREIAAQILTSEYSGIAENVGGKDGPIEVALDHLAAHGVEALLGAWLEPVKPTTWIMAALQTLLDPNAKSLTWELPRERLIGGLKDIVLFLRTDAIGACAADAFGQHIVHDLVAALQSAQAWLAELGIEAEVTA
jgi:hypothetical protein